jgi:hypothetical protein
VDDVYARRRTLCAGGERVAATSKQGLLALDRRKVSLAVKLSYGIACGMGSLFLRPNGGAGPAGWVNSAPRLCRSSIVPCRGWNPLAWRISGGAKSLRAVQSDARPPQ